MAKMDLLSGLPPSTPSQMTGRLDVLHDHRFGWIYQTLQFMYRSKLDAEEQADTNVYLSFISQAAAEQDSFFAMMDHVQREHMEDQRCSLTPSSSTQNLSRDRRPGSPAATGQRHPGESSSWLLLVGPFSELPV